MIVEVVLVPAALLVHMRGVQSVKLGFIATGLVHYLLLPVGSGGWPVKA